MNKNTLIGVLVAVIVVVVGGYFILHKSSQAPVVTDQATNTDQNQSINTTPQNNPTTTQIKLPTSATLLAQSADKTYSAYTAFSVSDRSTKLPQMLRMTEQDIAGKGDTVYLKNNTTGQVTQIFSDTNSQELSVKNGQFLAKNNLFLFETGTLFAYDLSSKVVTKHLGLAPNGCSTGNVQFVSPNETSIVVSGWCGQEGGHQTIVDLNSWKVSWSVQAGIGAGKTIEKYNSDQTVLVAVDDDIGPITHDIYSLNGTPIQH